METIINTNYGKIEGFTKHDVQGWLGIPYAAPPVDELRFRRAVECKPWDDIKSCQAYGSKPIQFSIREQNKNAKHVLDNESEDCLNMNIWRPASDVQKLPVFVWIYGGAFHMGEASDLTYSGESFGRQDVIFVSFNYRVGVLGFYDFTVYDKEGFDSNCGLSDQIAAIKWIKENIEHFGGDPNNITIAGESAGASSCCALLTSPQTQGLINKAIIQSPVVECAASANSMKLNVDLFLEQMNIKSDQVTSLRQISAQNMLAASRYILTKATDIYPGILVPAPTFDDLLPENPINALAKGVASHVKMIIGTNKDEGSMLNKGNMFPTTWERIAKMLELNNQSHKLEEIKELYKDKGNLANQMNLLTADRAFLINTIKLADEQSQYNKVWMYRYDFAPFLTRILRFGAMHGVEVPIVMNTLHVSGGFLSSMWKGTGKKTVTALIQAMHGSWVQFAKTGDPNGQHLPISWDTYSKGKRPTLIFNKELNMVNNPNEKNYEVWKDVTLYQ